MNDPGDVREHADAVLGVHFPIDARFEEQRSAGAAVAGVPSAHVESWAVYAGSRKLALQLMVQPPERWQADFRALALPFSTLQLRETAADEDPAG